MKTFQLSQRFLDHAATAYACHCCGSATTAYLQHYVLRRSLATAPMYLCADCDSISVDAEVVKRHYPQSNSREAIEFHRKIVDRNTGWANALLDAAGRSKGDMPPPAAVIDIGCGGGTLLAAASQRGLGAIGYEVDPLAVEEARKLPGVSVFDELFTRNAPGVAGAMVCCIMVLEHLAEPLSLLGEIAEYCNRHRASAFVSVPLLADNWADFLDSSVLAKGNPFFDNEEHISHFSRRAFSDAWYYAFQAEPVWITAGGWHGCLWPGSHT